MQAKTRRVLVVDDEESVRQVLSEGLKAAGINVETASGGAEGAERALTFQPDLILLDLMMPKVDGWQTVERLRKQEKTSKIPIIFLTAKSETSELLRSEEAKILDYFIKPIEIKELIRYIDRYIYRG